MKKSEKRKPLLRKLLYVTLCAGVGVMVGWAAGKAAGPDRFKSPGAFLMSFGLFLLSFGAAVLIQIVLHEGGHLLFGLATGYRFQSFRVGSRMLLRTPDGLRWQKFSLPGTGGQCLMDPPDAEDGESPWFFYHMGGVLMNLISALFFWWLRLALPEIPFLTQLLTSLSWVGVGFAVLNGVPLHAGPIDNDGFNAWTLWKKPRVRRDFWVQLEVQRRIALGQRLRDMPDALFELPEPGDMDNALTTAVAVLAANRLSDLHRLDEACNTVRWLLEGGFQLAGIHRSLLRCELICREVTGENRPAVLNHLLDREQRQFMNAMKDFPTVLRTEYLVALLHENDAPKADAIRTRLEQLGASYPYPQDIQSERELMDPALWRAEP